MRLVYLDSESKDDILCRFHYIERPWLHMFTIQIYPEEERVDDKPPHTTHVLILSNTGVGVDRVV